ncbi:MAG: S8 family peptidase, partial [Rhizomicrobium sp.]
MLGPVAASLLAFAGAAFADPSASSFDTPEYYASGGLAQIHADEAYALGYTGAGITIAVFDTGIDPSHPEFAGKTISGYDYVFGSSSNLFDPIGHGTHVAGIAAADRDGAGMQGVAYDANIMSFNILVAPDPLSAFLDGVDRMVANNVRIASNSWTFFLDRTDTALMDSLHSKLANAEDHGMIFVFAAGNFGDIKPWDPADTPEFMPDLQKQWIAVTAVDANNVIASFANRCGPNAAWCIAAPGVDIYSTIPGGGYASLSGTSMATPLVSGALALVEQAFPYMTPEQWVQTILTTATPIGPAEIYGHGLLNVGAAVRGPGSFDMDWSVN